MRKVLFFLLFLVQGSLFCSAKEGEGLVVSYKSLTRDVEEQAIPKSDVWNLKIIDGQSDFKWQQDSMCLKYYSYFEGDYELAKNLPSEGELMFKGDIRSDRDKRYYVEDIPDYGWELLDADTVICDYPCQKAQMTFRGRTWIVWYSQELPYSDGPWKLCGLPGLILQAQDLKGDFSFTAFKIAKCEDEKITIKTNGYVKTTPRQFVEDMIHSYKDSQDYYEATTGVKGEIYIDGKLWKPESKTACLMEYFEDNKKK